MEAKLPDGSGLALCAKMRNLQIPVILVTARTTDPAMIEGFKHGADDYITKPFNMQLLIYRVRAVLRRVQPEGDTPHEETMVFPLGRALFNPRRHEITGDSGQVKLTQTQSAILHLLLTHEGQIVPAERILERIWGYNTESSVNVVKTHIHHLPSKVAGVVGDVPVIQTAAGGGYMCVLSQHA
jgi:DNA-binding response OmpR family regulator